MRQPGIIIMVNKDNDKVWISAAGDCLSVLRQKVSAINSCIVKDGSYTNVLPSSLQTDIAEKGENVFDVVYLLSYDKEELINFFRTNKINLVPSRFNSILKSYVRHVLFDKCDIYGSEESFNGSRDNYKIVKQNAWTITRMIDSGIIKIYKTKDLSYDIAKTFKYEPSSIEEVLSYKRKTKNKKTEKENKSMDPVVNETANFMNKLMTNLTTENTAAKQKKEKNSIDIYKLLEIEAILRGVDNKEELMRDLISDKAIKIYETMVG